MVNKIQRMVVPLMDELQWCMENNAHLEDPDRVSALIDRVSIYIAHLTDEDADYLHAAQDAIEEGREWNVKK